MDRPPNAPQPDDEATQTPRWVYLAGVVVILAAIGFVVMHLSGGGIPSH